MAIIIIVTAIGIPNYNMARRNSAQNEGKFLLTQLHITQKQFNIEFLGGTTDLTATGFNPEGKLTYAVGFGTDTPTVTGTLNQDADGDCPHVPMLCMATASKVVKNGSSCTLTAIPTSSLGGSRFPYKALELQRRYTQGNSAKSVCFLPEFDCIDGSGLQGNRSGTAAAPRRVRSWLNQTMKFNGAPLTNEIVKTLTANCNGGDINGTNYGYGWKAVAVADLGAADRDVWTISHEKHLEHVSDGT